MRLAESPRGTPFQGLATEPEFEAVAAFGPGRRYWTMAGTVLIGDRHLWLVLPPEDAAAPPRLVVSEPIEGVSVVAKPRWSFGTGLYLRIGDDMYTLEPQPIYGHATTPGRIRRAREAVREFELALAAAQAAAARRAQRVPRL